MCLQELQGEKWWWEDSKDLQRNINVGEQIKNFSAVNNRTTQITFLKFYL